MALTADHQQIEQLPLFAGMTVEARRMLFAKALVHRAPAGTVLFEQGDVLAFQHVLLSGAVQLMGLSQGGGAVSIEIVESPDLLLPSAVATASPCLVQARTLEPARLLLIEASEFRRVLAADVALANAAIESLSGQFRRLLMQIKDLKLRTAPQRVGHYIFGLSRRQGSDVVTLPYEKGLIASELGMTRESFSRALAALQHEGAVCRGDVVTIVDRERLEAFFCPDPLVEEGDAYPT